RHRPDTDEPRLSDHFRFPLDMIRALFCGRGLLIGSIELAEGDPVVDDVPGILPGQLPGLLADLWRRQVVVDDTAGRLDHPLEVVAVVDTVAVDVDLADQGEPHRLVRRPCGRVDEVAWLDRVDVADRPEDPSYALRVVDLDQLHGALRLVGGEARRRRV